VVNAHASILDVNTHLPSPLPESSEYSTVAGFVNVIFSGIPEVGQEMNGGAYRVKVLKRSRGSVDSVLLTVLSKDVESDTPGVSD
jgi:CBS domain containing-hemolysin-like protein